MNTGGQASPGHKIHQLATEAVYHESPLGQTLALGNAGGTKSTDTILGDCERCVPQSHLGNVSRRMHTHILEWPHQRVSPEHTSAEGTHGESIPEVPTETQRAATNLVRA